MLVPIGYGGVSINGIVNLTANDTLEMWVKCITTTGTLVRGRDVDLVATRIG